jgi:hypothetical protein
MVHLLSPVPLLSSPLPISILLSFILSIWSILLIAHQFNAQSILLPQINLSSPLNRAILSFGEIKQKISIMSRLASYLLRDIVRSAAN